MAIIEYLGQLSARCGPAQDITLPETISDIAALRDWLSNRFEGDPLASSSVRAIVNGEVAVETQAISNTDTIAFFPPVGGG